MDARASARTVHGDVSSITQAGALVCQGLVSAKSAFFQGSSVKPLVGRGWAAPVGHQDSGLYMRGQPEFP